MKYPGFCGPSYQSQAITADNERTMNLYLERMESPGATTRMALYPTPGVETITTFSNTGGRAHFFNDGREFLIVGTGFVEMDEDGAATSRGTVAINSTNGTISSNGDGGGELFITSGGNGYVYNLGTDTLSTISALSGKATMGDQLDGYFLDIDAATGTLYASDLLDGTTWTTGTMFAQRISAPDPWVAMKVKGKLIWLLGSQTSEVWYNNGDSPFPFAPHPSGTLVEYGIAAPFSAAVCDTSLLWLGASKGGDAYVLRANGFAPEVISTYAVQRAIGQYDTISDAYADSYTEEGHTFYVLTFPTANATWVYDLQMQQWHERGTWDPDDNAYSRWRPKCHAFAFGEHRWLDAESGAIYRSSVSLGSDAGGLAIRRERIPPTLMQENERVVYRSFELDIEPGLGLVTGQGSAPKVMLSISRDGGKTWGAEVSRSIGKMGQYDTRVTWERLGQARRFVPKVVMTDPVPCRILGAYVQPEPEQRSA